MPNWEEDIAVLHVRAMTTAAILRDRGCVPVLRVPRYISEIWKMRANILYQSPGPGGAMRRYPHATTPMSRHLECLELQVRVFGVLSLISSLVTEVCKAACPVSIESEHV
jgi:hypothetical protein